MRDFAKYFEIAAETSAWTLFFLILAGSPVAVAGEPNFLGKSLGEWTKQLADPIEPARLQAVAALGQMGPSAVGALLAAADAKEESTRHWAAAGLGRNFRQASENEREQILRTLKERLKDRAATVRVTAAFALAMVGESAVALPVLEAALTDAVDGVRIQAASALHDLGEAARPALPALRAAKGDKNEYVVRLSTRAVARLEGGGL